MGTKIASESFMAILPELLPLFALHYRETGLYRDWPGRLTQSPQVERYKYAEQNKILLTLTARLDGELVGYYIALAQHALHYAEVGHGYTDMPYVHPKVRHRGIGLRLFLEAEKTMRECGVKIWQAGSKIDSELHPSMDRMLRHLGFAPTDLIYSKWLGD